METTSLTHHRWVRVQTLLLLLIAMPALGDLRDPPAGIHPPNANTFTYLDNVPVFMGPAGSQGTHAGLPWFFDLIAVAQLDDPMRRDAGIHRGDRALELARRFVASESRGNYLGQGAQNWAGATEFDRADSRAAFLRDYESRLRDMAPSLPVVFGIAEERRVGDYDADRGGFPIVTSQMRPGAIDIHGAGLGWFLTAQTSELELPAPFWQIDAGAARTMAARFEGDLRPSDRTRRPRTVRMVVFFDATLVDEAQGTVQLRRLHTDIYDHDLHERLHRLPDAAAEVPVVRGGRTSPAGILPGNWDVTDGVYVNLSSEQARTTVRESGGLLEFYAALILGAELDRLDIDDIPALAQRWMTRQAFRQYVDRRQWAGSSEAERAATRQRFEAEILPALRGWLPQTPARARTEERARLSRDDAGDHHWRLLPAPSMHPTGPQGITAPSQTRGGQVWGPNPDMSYVIEQRVGSGLERSREGHQSFVADAATSERLSGLPVVDTDRRTGRDVHEVILQSEFEIERLDTHSRTMIVAHRSVSVLDAASRQPLLALPLAETPLPFLVRETIPATLDVAEPLLLGDHYLQLLLQREGLAPFSDGDLSALAHEMLRRDALFRQPRPGTTPPDTRGWSINDARWPFWRADLRAGQVAPAQAADPGFERLRAWLQAYARGLGDAVRLYSLERLPRDPEWFVTPLRHRGQRLGDRDAAVAVALGVEPDRLLILGQLTAQQAGNAPRVYGLLPEPLGHYGDIEVSPTLLAERAGQPIPAGQNLDMHTELRVTGIESIPGHDPADYVVRIEPRSIHLLFEGREVAVLPIIDQPPEEAAAAEPAAPAPAAPEPEPEPPEVAAAFNVLGIQLGDDLDSAIEDMAERITDAEVTEGESDNSYPWSPFRHYALIHAPDWSEAIVLFHAPPTSDRQVTGVARMVEFPPDEGPIASRLFASMAERYGEGESRGDGSRRWVVPPRPQPAMPEGLSVDQQVARTSALANRCNWQPVEGSVAMQAHSLRLRWQDLRHDRQALLVHQQPASLGMIDQLEAQVRDRDPEFAPYVCSEGLASAAATDDNGRVVYWFTLLGNPGTAAVIAAENRAAVERAEPGLDLDF
ncbi:MAG: hypothetical protein JJU27_13530 [Gammaproteobacteria bacterium]|nr:hypothetical protein [Gammaproteobacteria bacterium]